MENETPGTGGEKKTGRRRMENDDLDKGVVKHRDEDEEESATQRPAYGSQTMPS